MLKTNVLRILPFVAIVALVAGKFFTTASSVFVEFVNDKRTKEHE